MIEIATQLAKFGAASTDLIRRIRAPRRDFSPYAPPARVLPPRGPFKLEIIPLLFSIDLERRRIEITLRAINYTRHRLQLKDVVIDQLNVGDLPVITFVPGIHLGEIRPRSSSEITCDRALNDTEVLFIRSRRQECPIIASAQFVGHAYAGRKLIEYRSYGPKVIVGSIRGLASALQN